VEYDKLEERWVRVEEATATEGGVGWGGVGGESHVGKGGASKAGVGCYGARDRSDESVESD